MSSCTSISSEDDVGTLVDGKTVILVPDRTVLDCLMQNTRISAPFFMNDRRKHKVTTHEVRRGAIKAICVVSRRFPITLGVWQITLRYWRLLNSDSGLGGLLSLTVVNGHPRNNQRTRVRNAKGLSRRVNHMHVFEETGYFNPNVHTFRQPRIIGCFRNVLHHRTGLRDAAI